MNNSTTRENETKYNNENLLDLPSATLIQAGRTMRSDTGGAARAEI